MCVCVTLSAAQIDVAASLKDSPHESKPLVSDSRSSVPSVVGLHHKGSFDGAMAVASAGSAAVVALGTGGSVVPISDRGQV